MRWLITDTSFNPLAYTHSLLTNVVAIVIALWIRMSVETYPGIRAGQTILPSVLAGHAAAIGLLIPWLHRRDSGAQVSISATPQSFAIALAFEQL